MLVDHARPERLGELVRTLLPLAPELEVHTEVQQLAEVRPGSTLVLVPRAEDADWLNINRPLFASKPLRVVLFCTREVSVALSRGAVDFLDWISLRLECPAGPAPFAVAGLRCALAARVPGIVWTGGDLEASFHAARPRRVLRRVSAARPYEELVAEVKAGGRGDWLAWTEVDGDFRLRRVRWALAEAGRQTRAILVEPAVRSPGWWEVHGRVAELNEARERLRQAGAEQPGRLMALVDLEPEAIELLGRLLEGGIGARTLEEELRKGADPGATVGRLASVHGVVTQRELVRGRSPPPAMRAFGAEPARMRLLHGAEVDAIEQLLSQGGQVDVEDVGWWSAWTRALPSQEWFEDIETSGEFAEALLRNAPRTGPTWTQLAFVGMSAGDLSAAHVWAQRTAEVDPARWRLLFEVLRKQGNFVEAESILRHRLAVDEHMPDMERGSILLELGNMLQQQGRYAEAELLLRQSLTIENQVHGPQHPDYGTSLHSLAMVLERQGRYAEAEELLRKSLTISEQAHGPRHVDHAASLHSLAMVLSGQGRYAEAEELLRKSMAIVEQELGPRHVHYSSSLHELAGVLGHQGRYAEAEQLLRQSLLIKEQALGAQHPDYSVALHELARVLQSLGRYVEAEQLLRQSLVIAEQSLGPQHPFYGISLLVLAGVLQSQGQYAEAEKLLRQCLAIQEQALGPQHPEYGTSLHELARVLQAQGRYAEAEKLLRQSLAIQEQALGLRHPQLSPTLANLGFILANQKRPLEGEPFLLRSVDISRERFGLNHPGTAQGLSLLAHVQATLKKPEAVTTARQAIDALRGSLGPEHPTTKEALPALQRIVAGGG
ncbi:MAG TPA: tetratricopeptide repeat protein [Archangium sp.]|uniref:tetratricopeptide repeat protein n=1 Tax=Archangium sp. TaxID=1872627 RepID=UPI002ED91CA1